MDVVVLCEIVRVLRGAYSFPKGVVADALDRVLDAGRLSIDDRDLLREALASYREGRGDFADCVMGLRNRRAGCSATVTFDRALKRNPSFTVI